jgi:hypothetical protein
MLKTARLKAEEQFAATQRKAKKALNEKEKRVLPRLYQMLI